MGFGDLKSAPGLAVLNEFLSDRSYVEGSVNSSTVNHGRNSRFTVEISRNRLQLLLVLPAAPSWLCGELTWLAVS